MWEVTVMDFDLRQLEVFCAVVEERGFSSGAAVVHLTQASVSERIANLEASVGTRLLDRLGRVVTPPRAGELLYRRAKELLGRHLEVKQELEEFLGRRRGTLEIGGSTVPGNYILPGLLGRFRSAYPEVTVSVFVGDSSTVTGRVERGELEAGVVGAVMEKEHLEHVPLWQDEVICVACAAHRWSGLKESLSPGALLEEPFVSREGGSGTWHHLEGTLSSLFPGGLGGLKPACILGSSDGVKEAVKGGVGYSFISRRAVQTELAAGLLCEVSIEGFHLSRHFYLVSDRRRSPSPLRRAFIDYLLEESRSD